MALLRSEMRVSYGAVGDSLGDSHVGIDAWLFHEDQFLLRLPELAFHYAIGQGVTVERRAGTTTSEEALFLNGSVYAAVACLNGYYPIHASAVVANGAAHAFTGPSGAGKSTLVTALGNLGLPMFCDDTLVLDLSDPEVPLALPGHKRLKLTEEALALTGAHRQEQVDDAIAKFYAEPPAGNWSEPLPLAQLVFLENGDETAAFTLTGAEKLARLSDDHYTAKFQFAATRLDALARFNVQARLANQVSMSRLVRPRDIGQFARSLSLAHELVCSHDVGPCQD